MKKIVLVAAFAVLLVNCQDKKETEVGVVETENTSSYASFGESISEEGALSSTEMMEKFASLKEGDTSHFMVIAVNIAKSSTSSLWSSPSPS